MNTYEYALNYHDLGWTVIPIYPNSKKPMVKWKEFADRRPTQKELKEWFKGTDNNIAVLTGPSDLLVVDIDSHKGETDKWEGPATAFQMTPSGGLHYFYTGGGHLKTGQGDLGQHIDTRGAGGYVLVEPSIIDGNQYRMYDADRIVEVPENIAAKLSLAPATETLTPQQERDILTKVLREGFTSGQHNSELLDLTKELYRALYGNSKQLKDQVLWNIVSTLDSLDPTPQAYDGTLKPTVDQAIKYEKTRLSDKKSGRPKLEVVSYSDSMSKWHDYQTRYLIDGWFPEASLMYMAALPESWKTWMLLDMALSLSLGKGEPFLNHFNVTPHLPMRDRIPVLLFQQEDHPGELMKRMQIIQMQKIQNESYQCIYDSSSKTFYFDSPYSAPLYIHENAELLFDNPEMFEVLEERIVQTGAKVVLIDPVYSLMPATNFFSEMGMALKHLKGIRVRTGAAFMFAHHNKKSAGSADGRQGAYGSVFFDGGMEGALSIYKTADPTTVKVQRSGKFLAERTQYRLTFDVNDGYRSSVYDPSEIRYVVDVQQGEDHFTGQYDEDIYQFVLENNSVNAKAIEEKLDISRSTVYNVLKKLEESGHIIKNGRNYEIPLEIDA